MLNTAAKLEKMRTVNCQLNITMFRLLVIWTRAVLTEWGEQKTEWNEFRNRKRRNGDSRYNTILLRSFTAEGK